MCIRDRPQDFDQPIPARPSCKRVPGEAPRPGRITSRSRPDDSRFGWGIDAEVPLESCCNRLPSVGARRARASS
eukprot:7613884-Alexandrium_andersonii.AAC.1